MGQDKGQWRNPEVLCIDSNGLIFVGDSGNCRIQVFNQRGEFIRVIGGKGVQPGHFNSISGLCVTEDGQILVTDARNQCFQVFE